MTVVAMWCRHSGDNVIGIEAEIPWRVESDAKHFLDVVKGQTVVVGRKTYESFPQRTLPECRIFVLSTQADYEVADDVCHKVISGQKALADFEGDLYVAGGAAVYQLFMNGKEKLKPQIIVDCVYDGEMLPLAGRQVDISASVALMEKQYRRITPVYFQDNVGSSIWVRKGEFVEQSVLKRIIRILEQNAVISW